MHKKEVKINIQYDQNFCEGKFLDVTQPYWHCDFYMDCDEDNEYYCLVYKQSLHRSNKHNRIVRSNICKKRNKTS